MNASNLTDEIRALLAEGDKLHPHKGPWTAATDAAWAAFAEHLRQFEERRRNEADPELLASYRAMRALAAAMRERKGDLDNIFSETSAKLVIAYAATPDDPDDGEEAMQQRAVCQSIVSKAKGGMLQ